MEYEEFLQACRSNDFAKLAHLLRAQPLFLDRKVHRLGVTPLFEAILSNSYSLAHFLLESGADPNVTCVGGNTALHEAADNGLPKLVSLLLAYAADCNVPNNEGETALHHATFRGDYDIVKLLIEAGADPNIRSQRTLRTALHNVVLGKQTESITLLLEAGANSMIPDKDFNTPLGLAYGRGLSKYFETKELATLLVENGLQTISERPSDEEALTSPQGWLVARRFKFDTPKAAEEPDAEKSIANLCELGEFLYRNSLGHLYLALKNSEWNTYQHLIGSVYTENHLSIERFLELGLKNIGECVTLILAVETAAGLISSIGTVYQFEGALRVTCCSRQMFRKDSDGWMQLLGNTQYIKLFKKAGYSSAEMVLRQMNSRYPVTDKLLETIGVHDEQSRHQLLIRLNQESRLCIGKDLVTQNSLTCGCNVM